MNMPRLKRQVHGYLKAKNNHLKLIFIPLAFSNFLMLFLRLKHHGLLATIFALITILIAIGAMFSSDDVMGNHLRQMPYVKMSLIPKAQLSKACSLALNVFGIMLLGLIVLFFSKFIGFILLLVGIWYGSRNSQAPYIYEQSLMHQKRISSSDACKLSHKLMKKHLKEFLTLQVSLIVWYGATLITCGLAGFYTIPYIYLVNANYYKQLNIQLASNINQPQQSQSTSNINYQPQPQQTTPIKNRQQNSMKLQEQLLKEQQSHQNLMNLKQQQRKSIQNQQNHGLQDNTSNNIGGFNLKH